MSSPQALPQPRPLQKRLSRLSRLTSVSLARLTPTAVRRKRTSQSSLLQIGAQEVTSAINLNATRLQACWRGRLVRQGKAIIVQPMSRAATTLQASWRGRQARKDPEEVLIEKLRADIGRLMYPMRTGALRDTALCTLEVELAGKVPEDWSNLANLSTLLSGTPSLITVEGDAAR